MTYAPSQPAPCKNCGAPCRAHGGQTSARRGLCRTCYRDPDIRGRYPLGGHMAALGAQSPRERDTEAPSRPPPEPSGRRQG
jgi:hypothetical protein